MTLEQLENILDRFDALDVVEGLTTPSRDRATFGLSNGFQISGESWSLYDTSYILINVGERSKFYTTVNEVTFLVRNV